MWSSVLILSCPQTHSHSLSSLIILTWSQPESYCLTSFSLVLQSFNFISAHHLCATRPFVLHQLLSLLIMCSSLTWGWSPTFLTQLLGDDCFLFFSVTFLQCDLPSVWPSFSVTFLQSLKFSICRCCYRDGCTDGCKCSCWGVPPSCSVSPVYALSPFSLVLILEDSWDVVSFWKLASLLRSHTYIEHNSSD